MRLKRLFSTSHRGGDVLAVEWAALLTNGVRIWKFCNPDPIRNFFIDSVSNPYLKV